MLNSCLSCVSVRFLRENAGTLLQSAQTLLVLVETEQVLDRSLFRTHGLTLAAVHQILVLVKKFTETFVNMETDDGGIYQTFERCINRIIRGHCYYPFQFWAVMIEQGLVRLTRRESVWRRALRHTYDGVSGVACLLLAAQRSVMFLGGLDSLEEAGTRLWRAFTKAVPAKKEWYSRLLPLVVVSRPGVHESRDIERELAVSCNAAIQYQRTIRNNAHAKSLLYGIVYCLRKLIHDPLARNVRRTAARMLLDLAWGIANGQRRNEDPDLVEALLAAVADIHATEMYEQEATDLLRQFTDPQTTSFEAGAHQWLDGHTQAARLEQARTELVAVRSMSEHVTELLRQYTSTEFSEIPSILGDGRPGHLRNYNFNLVVYIPDNPASASDQNAPQRQCRTYSTKPVCIEHILLAESRRVLLFGAPGSGKTSVGRKLAYDWASGTLEDQFDVVYFLPLRELSALRYAALPPDPENLADAIVEISFRGTLQPIEDLRQSVVEDLHRSSTLLILDGPDEARDLGLTAISQARALPCKLLLLSRPYSLHERQSDFDRQVECKGLSCGDLRRLIETDLGDESFNMIRYLNQHSHVERTAHLPVIAQILCGLWQSGEPDIVNEPIEATSNALYTSIAHCIWRRFSERIECRDMQRDTIFEALQNIAFSSLEHDRALISFATIEEEGGANNQIAQIIKDCGLLVRSADGANYHFLHQTYRDYFAGRYMARVLCNCQHPKNEDIRRFLSTNKYWEIYDAAFSFMTQEICKTNGRRGYDLIMELLDARPLEHFGMQHQFLRARFLDSALNGAGPTTRRLITRDPAAEEIVESAASVLFALRPQKVFLAFKYPLARSLSPLVRHFPSLLDGWIDQELAGEDIWNCRRRNAAVGFGLAAMLTQYIPNSIHRLASALKRMVEERPIIFDKAAEEMRDLLAADSELYGTPHPYANENNLPDSSESEIIGLAALTAHEDTTQYESSSVSSSCHFTCVSSNEDSSRVISESSSAMSLTRDGVNVDGLMNQIEAAMRRGNVRIMNEGYRVIYDVTLNERLAGFWRGRDRRAIPLLTATFLRMPVIVTPMRSSMRMEWYSSSEALTEKIVTIDDLDQLQRAVNSVLRRGFPDLAKIVRNEQRRRCEP